MAVVAVRGPNPATPVLSDKPALTHDVQYLLVVYGIAAAGQLLSYPAISITGEFIDDGLNLSNEFLVIICRLLWLMIIGEL